MLNEKQASPTAEAKTNRTAVELFSGENGRRTTYEIANYRINRSADVSIS